MEEPAIHLRPVLEAELATMARFSLEPEALGEFLWRGFSDPKVRRRRWEEDGLLGADSSILAVALRDETFIGFVSWRQVAGGSTRGAPVAPQPSIPHLEIGIALLPEHRRRGHGTAAQRLLIEYLFDTTAVYRIQALTETDNISEQRALEAAGFQREGVLRALGYRRGKWVDGVVYSILRHERL